MVNCKLVSCALSEGQVRKHLSHREANLRNSPKSKKKLALCFHENHSFSEKEHVLNYCGEYLLRENIRLINY